jgi:cytochrome c-type biogenesis protein CcsB
MKLSYRLLPILPLALFLAEVIAVLTPKHDGQFHLAAFGRLPVLLNGRVQPFDSVGRNSLLQIRSTTDVPLEEVPSWKFLHHAKKIKSTEWLLELMTKPEQASQRPVFLIHHPELLRTLKLDETGVEKSGLRYYTYLQIEPLIPEINELAGEFDDINDKHRTPYQRQLLKLQGAITLYQRLALSLQPPGTHDLAGTVAEFDQLAPAGARAVRAYQSGQAYDTNTLTRFVGLADGFLQVANSALPLTIPPRDPNAAPDQWVNFGTGVMDSIRAGEMHPGVEALAAAASAYHQGDAAKFNQAVDGYANWFQAHFPAEIKKGGAEYYFNNIRAFLHALIIYGFAFLAAGLALLMFAFAPGVADIFRRTSVWLIVLAWLVHTFGLVFRMVLEGRPPVTNLYSSAIFIGWGAVILGLVLERVFRVGLGCAVASLAGLITLFIAHNLALGGDTMEMLQAVLDTNFWLATHVTIVTLGYASTFVAGLLGIAYVVLGLFTPLLSRPIGPAGAAAMALPATGVVGAAAMATHVSKRGGQIEIGRALVKMIYAIVCFATLFSFVGTVLGGIWADQSWGRFWGWDPKENGALIIVLWNALILHARWGGMVRERGLAVMSIFGNIVTSYSWFGVNMLGIGLHSYGFMDAAFKWLLLFIGGNLVLIGMGSLPLTLWSSFRRGTVPPPVPESGPPRSGRPAPAAT